jgi:protein TonB
MPVHRIVQVRRGSNGAIVLETPGLFLAECHPDGGDVVGLARLAPGLSEERGDWARFRLVRVEWALENRLLVKWSSPGNGHALSRETWSHSSEWHPPGTATLDSLPAAGQVAVDQLPEPIVRVPPSYPDLAREKGVQGQVVVMALVGTDGLVKETFVASSVPMLDEASVAAVRAWKFKPAMKGGSPVAVWTSIPVKFSLH